MSDLEDCGRKGISRRPQETVRPRSTLHRLYGAELRSDYSRDVDGGAGYRIYLKKKEPATELEE